MGLLRLYVRITVRLTVTLITAWLISKAAQMGASTFRSIMQENPSHRLSPNMSAANLSSSRIYYVDTKKLYNDYNIHPELCTKPGFYPFLLLGVISKPSSFSRRQAVRKTWGSLANPLCGARLYFIMGKIHDTKTQRMILAEAVKFDDILQCDRYDDTYRASSLKTLYFFQWAAAFCPNATYVSRIDDDNWLNLPWFYQFMRSAELKQAVYGTTMFGNSTVVRAPDTKYHVPREEYESPVYPEYSSGMFFTVPAFALPALLFRHKFQNTVFLDDVYVAGILATSANFSRVQLPYMGWSPTIKETSCPKKDYMCIHYTTIKEFHELWNDRCHTYDELCEL